jgi:hypothetical protein
MLKTNFCRFPKWQPLYNAVIAESDPTKLREKASALETAIFNRFQELAEESDHHTERDALHLAVDNLKHIQETKLGYPVWERPWGQDPQGEVKA